MKLIFFYLSLMLCVIKFRTELVKYYCPESTVTKELNNEKQTDRFFFNYYVYTFEADDVRLERKNKNRLK